MPFRTVHITALDPLWPLVVKNFPHVVEWIDDPRDTGDYQIFLSLDRDDRFLAGAVLDADTIGLGPQAERSAGCLEDFRVEVEDQQLPVGVDLLQTTLSYAWRLGLEYVRWTVDYESPLLLEIYDGVGCAFLPEEDPYAANPDLSYTVVAINPGRAALHEARKEDDNDINTDT